MLALFYLKPELANHQLYVFYTNKPSGSQNPPSALKQLRAFEQSILVRHQRFLESMNAQLMNDINGNDFQRFANTEPDLVLSIRHMSILKSNVIDTPELGVINLHSGPLPDYQGVMATFWAMLNKETKLGTTLHLIEDSSIDRGSIIAASHQQARYDKSYFWNTLNLYKEGCMNTLAAVERLSQGKALMSSAQCGQGQYYGFPTELDFTNFEPELFSENDSLVEFMS